TNAWHRVSVSSAQLSSSLSLYSHASAVSLHRPHNESKTQSHTEQVSQFSLPSPESTRRESEGRRKMKNPVIGPNSSVAYVFMTYYSIGVYRVSRESL
ncbi:hypothetical protein TorRG33x02_092000, partial [Trema orientale]